MRKSMKIHKVISNDMRFKTIHYQTKLERYKAADLAKLYDRLVTMTVIYINSHRTRRMVTYSQVLDALLMERMPENSGILNPIHRCLWNKMYPGDSITYVRSTVDAMRWALIRKEGGRGPRSAREWKRITKA
jgi:hypothetical protein